MTAHLRGTKHGPRLPFQAEPHADMPSLAPAVGTSVPFGAFTIMPRWEHDARIEAEAAVRHCHALIQRRLAEAEERERLGYDATEVRALIRTFQRLLAEHEAYRDRLSTDLRRPGSGGEMRRDQPGTPPAA